MCVITFNILSVIFTTLRYIEYTSVSHTDSSMRRNFRSEVSDNSRRLRNCTEFLDLYFPTLAVFDFRAVVKIIMAHKTN